MSFSQPLCQIDKRAAPAGHTRRTAQTPRVTFLKSHRDVIAFGCYRTRWDYHINLRMKDITFLPWKLSQKTKLTRLKRGRVSQRGPWPEPKTRFSLPIAHCRLTIEPEVASFEVGCVVGTMRVPCACHREEPCFSGDEGSRQFACKIHRLAAGTNCRDASRSSPWAKRTGSARQGIRLGRWRRHAVL
jgi:hypothetical protein